MANPIALLQKYLFFSKEEKLRKNLTFPLKDLLENATPKSTQLWLLFTGKRLQLLFHKCTLLDNNIQCLIPKELFTLSKCMYKMLNLFLSNSCLGEVT